MPHAVRHEPVIAVLLPCYNEELTIGEVVRRFRETLPSAAVYVYDNNSKDLTALKARAAGAIVVREPRQGKGNVVRRMFADIDADIYVMADGDGTYAPEDSPQLINVLQTERSDMVVGTRRGVTDDAGRNGHAFGNHIFNRLYKGLFGTDFTDIFSGYRVFSRRFVKSFPAVSGGFEIETEMSVHASQLKLPVSEMALDYGRRPEGSSSKLSTFRDGARILWMFAMLVKETQPLRFFGTFALFFLAASIGLMIPVVIEFAETGLVPRMPTWVLSIGMLLLAMLSMMTGLILDSVSRGRAEQKRIFYLSISSGRAERGVPAQALPKGEAGKASRAA
ncbi:MULTISPECIES: glycosyltransferase [unclassified Mesorhizobium]|uniref:glycosyltransferase n=1 Tax=unclassified Mesorhizobium TaxID=325217 RepID=UPI000F754D40|nr:MULTISPECIES: glycosyltransferase [unclassified Mesorhizobium]AZO04342.1 glycosyltransferase [Mesorhizobium sp. M2A.F.Ca.ET.043.02.1.1]RUW38238.1 glycosyltransferase [Mesorhizobium sp. M2A.F.Ca.ET.015.02.1.1]RUW78709.1 glycosyltransferase [Mesorhizobium sp. M2A.F.Ca.ET.067.02.1.1]RVC94667.1 glycosyltransferase [Mesorhizobium sp. M2A.F.Ca.ET.017.03.2.1]RVD08043.1 glycosyltransferase [Mesorhizobium sp. M2A.F.Ca.ET.029.05.1.1]